VSQPSKPPYASTPTTPDAETGHPHSPYQRSGWRVRTHGLFVPKQSRRTCPDLGEAKPGVSLPHLRKSSEWVALSRPGPEHVGPRGPLWRGGRLPMTLRDQRAFAICLGGCDPGAQSSCPRSARDDGLRTPTTGLMRSVMPGRLSDHRGCAAQRRCGPPVRRSVAGTHRHRAPHPPTK
jgi:hypothetical protein